MRRVIVSAPGKLFLLGEHAVVYDGHALLTAVDSRLTLMIDHDPDATTPTVTIHAPNVGLDGWSASLPEVLTRTAYANKSSFIESCLKRFHEQTPLTGGFVVRTQSDFGAELGLGSSSAVVAATLYALAQLFAPDTNRMTLFEMGLDAIQRVQTLGSGADLAAAIFGGTIYYVNRKPRHVIEIPLDDLPLLIIYSETKAGTVNLVKEVRARYRRYPAIVEPIIHAMLNTVEQGKQALEAEDWPTFGELMNVQHGLLHALGVDTAALAEIVFTARQHGAFGAKLSGAGGGDCAIVLATEKQQAALQTAFADQHRRVLPFKPHADGVRVETAPIS